MKLRTLSLSIATLLSSNAFADASVELPDLVISADFRPTTALETPVSLTTIDEQTIEARGAQHVEDILNLAPNVNVSSGASRGQYYQIRGIGERSKFSEAPVNPAVGLTIDGIDFSRSGGAGTLFDIQSVEVLRGPQGTKFGSNALAGVINMTSTEPTEDFELHMEAGLAEYNTHNLGLAVGGALIENSLLGRLSIYSHQSDGYMDNVFLGRDNTQNHDEITARGHLKWLVSDRLNIDLNLLHLSIDNGYDAFTFDNSRNSTSDNPGTDAQNTNAVALKTDYRINSKAQLQSAITYSKSNLKYSYDADWSNVAAFNAAEDYDRERENYSVEFKLLSNENGLIFNGSTDWAIGLYHLDQDEGLNLNSDFGNLMSQYDTKNTSIFGQLNTHLSDKLTLISGLRLEHFEADYDDSNSLNIHTSENLIGGKLGLQYQVHNDHMVYSTLSRGYRSGGVNNNSSLLPSQRQYDTEYMWNIESGIKSLWLEGDLITSFNVFYSLRRDAQVKSSVDIGGGAFKDYIANAAKGKNYGVEAELDWLVNDHLRILSSIGLLKAEFDDYENPDPTSYDADGRDQAHAPRYQFSLGAEVYMTNAWTFRANIEGKDEFYFSNSHDSKSSSYAIVNSSLDYQHKNWKVSLWGRNLFDKDYYTRGFFFDNTPPLYDGSNSKTYKQYAEPRVVGLTLIYDY